MKRARRSVEHVDVAESRDQTKHGGCGGSSVEVPIRQTCQPPLAAIQRISCKQTVPRLLSGGKHVLQNIAPKKVTQAHAHSKRHWS